MIVAHQLGSRRCRTSLTGRVGHVTGASLCGSARSEQELEGRGVVVSDGSGGGLPVRIQRRLDLDRSKKLRSTRSTMKSECTLSQSVVQSDNLGLKI